MTTSTLENLGYEASGAADLVRSIAELLENRKDGKTANALFAIAEKLDRAVVDCQAAVTIDAVRSRNPEFA